MSQNRQSQIVQISLLKWISIFTQHKISSFQELTKGEIYFNLLAKVTHFKFIKPLKEMSFQEQTNLGLANRISNIKIIGQSIVRYYQMYLMKDVSQMKINYVQLCMGNSSQSIKLFSLLIGIFVLNQETQTLKRIQQSVNQLEHDDQYIVRALLQNSKTIGESILIQNQDSPMQKKIITKLQVYQEKIQNLEYHIQLLKAELEEQRNCNSSQKNQIKELKSQKIKLVQKSEVLQVLNSRLQSENSAFLMENQNLVKKIQSQKRNYQQIIFKNNQKIQDLIKEIQLTNFLKNEVEELKYVNKELQNQINEKNEYLKGQELKFSLMKQNYNQLLQNYKKLQQKCNQIELQYHQYKLKKESNQYDTHSKYNSRSPAYYVSNGSQISSVKYRMRDKLQSALKVQLSNCQMVDSHFQQNPKYQKGSLKQSSKSKQKQNSRASNIYNNLSNFIINQIGNPNIHDIEDVSQFQEPYPIEGVEQLDKSIIMQESEINRKDAPHQLNKASSFQNRNQINKQKSTHLEQQRSQPQLDNENEKNIIKVIERMQKKNKEQHSILIMIIDELFTQNIKLSEKTSQHQEYKRIKADRLQIFKKKLQKVREIQPLDGINSQFNKMKQNMNPNKALHFPISLNGQNSCTKTKQNIKNKENLSSSQSNKYPYYQMTLH